MATYRQVHVSFWQDAFVLKLTPEEKYFYLYLMTNSKTTQCGIYELPKKIICLETGYNEETVDKLLKRFIDYNKILYCENTSEIMIINWMKYNFINSEKVIACIEKELKNVKNKAFVKEFDRICKGYGYRIDTVGIDWGEEKEQKNNITENKYAEQVQQVFDFYKQTFGDMFKRLTLTKGRRDKIIARLKSGYSVEEICTAIKNIRQSSFHCGDNDKHMFYATLEFICRNDENLEKWINADISKQQPAKTTYSPYQDFDEVAYKC